MDADTGSASRRIHRSARTVEHGDEPLLNGLPVDGAGGGNDNEAGFRVTFLPFQYLRYDAEVFETSVGAGAYEHLVYFYIFTMVYKI